MPTSSSKITTSLTLSSILFAKIIQRARKYCVCAVKRDRQRKATLEEAKKHGPSYRHEYAAGVFEGVLNYSDDPTNPHSKNYWTFDPPINDPIIDPAPKDLEKLDQEMKTADSFFEKGNYPYSAFHYQLALKSSKMQTCPRRRS